MTHTETSPIAPPAPPREPDASRQDFSGLILIVLALVVLGVAASWHWVLFVVALVVMIFMHELGHFLTARWTGMKVTEFFIGFGPKLWSMQRGETEYGVKGIPGGAYVRIIGMNNLDEVDDGDEPRSYRVKSYPRKLLVVSAGSIMHFLMAFVLLYALLVGYGEVTSDDEWMIGSVSEQSAALDLGIRPGDVIMSVEGEAVGNFAHFGELVQARGGQVTEIVYERDGEVITDSVLIGARLTSEGAEAFEGLIPNDRILQIDGVDVHTWDDISAALAGRQGDTVSMIVDPVDSTELMAFDDVVVLEVLPSEAGARGFFGVTQRGIVSDVGPIDGVGRAGVRLADITWLSLTSMWDLITGGGLGNFVSDTITGDTESAQEQLAEARTSAERELAGRALDADNPDEDRIMSIYGAARAGRILSEEGFENVLFLLAAMNVFIGIFNMLPFPPLDGGHAIVATYERIRSFGGRRYEADYARVLPVTYVVFVLLVGFGLIALFRDIVDPINLG